MDRGRACAEYAEKAADTSLQPPPSRVYFLANSMPINRLD